MTAIVPMLLKVLTNKWTYVALGVAAILFLTWRVQVLSSENTRLGQNQEVLLDENRGKENKIGQLLLTVSEFKETEKDLLLKLDSVLDIKANQIEEVTKIQTVTKIEKEVVFKDSIIKTADTVYMTRCFNWEDEFTKISGCSIFSDEDTISISYESIDKLDIVMYWDKPGKWFLPRLFQKKRYEVAVVNENPNNKVIINNRIKIKRK
jgi:hypothetical protein